MNEVRASCPAHEPLPLIALDSGGRERRLKRKSETMDEIFVVQKRPTSGDAAEKFYFQIVDARTGERLMQSFDDVSEAERECQRLNRTETQKSQHAAPK